MGAKNIKTPHKKPRKGELTQQQKAENRAFSSHIIFIKYVIRLVKIFKNAVEMNEFFD